jgi:DNA-binding CsgD family transcriptional regulator
MAEGAFDRLAVGVVLLDVQGAPVMCNREAERIAARKDGFALDRYGPSADRPGDTKRMRDLIRSIGGDGPMGDRERAGTVRLLRPSGLPDYHVVILPLPRRCHSNCARGTASVLFVTDPEKSQSLVDLLFCGLFDLTEAEVRLVSSLLEGGGLPAAAEKLGLSRNTVHSQLSSVFLKTNTRSQSELLTLLLTSVAPVEPPDEASGYNWPSSQQGRVRG